MTEVSPEFFVDLTDGREFVVNSVLSGNFFGSLHVITLGTQRIGIDAKGKKQFQTAIVVRLRFDNEMAKILRDALDKQIAALTPPPDVKAN